VAKGSPLGGGCQWIGELGGCPHGATAELERRSGRRRRAYTRARGGATPFIGGVRCADLRCEAKEGGQGRPGVAGGRDGRTVGAGADALHVARGKRARRGV
jgi:hypothetical protein